jgi:monosaccharide ABC transporter substrate-binding protein, CUT2 family
MERRAFLAIAALGTLGTTTACTVESASSGQTDKLVSGKADAALKELQGKVLSKGPNGESPVTASTVELSEAEVAQVKARQATAAIVMHYAGNDWATAQIAGLKAEFARLGIQVIAVTDANFNPGQQVSDIETVLARHPDIVVSIPTDPVATANAYRQVTASNAKLVFMDNVPKGFRGGVDYESVVSADNFGNGVVSAHLLAKALNGKGDIGAIYHSADFFVTRQRYEGFREVVKKQYPGLKIVKTQGIAGPDFAGDAQKVADAMISQNPKLAGIWTVWDVPAEGVMAAARSADRNDLKIATEDLGTNVAIALAQDQLVVGLGAQQPYQQGVAEARIGAGALIGKKAPAYVALDALPVTHENVLESWKQVYNTEPPADLQKAMKK